MLYSYMLSKKGFTLVELMMVVAILGILVAVGVPVFSSGLKAQQKKDCRNQATVIQSSVQEAMVGMFDNGKSQPRIYFEKIQDDHEGTLPDSLEGIASEKMSAGDITCDNCLVLVYDQQIPGKIAFTLGDIRGGYRTSDIANYNDGCQYGFFLKKSKLKDNKFYCYLMNEEIPVCPFADYDDDDTENDYYYYILEDGIVYCSNPECNE